MRRILSVLLENESGALSRVVGLFSQRGYNIERLNVAPTDDHSLSRLTVTTTGDDLKVEQVTKQLNKIIDVVKVVDEVISSGKHKLHKDVASAVKASFDKLHPPADNKATSGVWHCIVGNDFACSVTHETHFSCYWSCNNTKRRWPNTCCGGARSPRFEG